MAAMRQSEMLWRWRDGNPTVAFAMEDAADDYKRRFGVQLMYLRTAAGISSQERFAELMSVSESKVQRWEAGDGLPDAYEISRLVKLLDCDVSELVFPEAMTARERELLRRVTRGRRRGQEPPSDGAPGPQQRPRPPRGRP
jgi:transcriptional regulator with XRE-family HTH domain